MTRDEAIERLKTDIYKYTDFTENPNENEFWMAFDMAIKALEHPERNVVAIVPCGDAISRQAMHIELEKWITYGEYKYSNATKYLYDRIDKLPSINPQEPKTGRWIISPNDCFAQCSECGLHGDKGIYKHYKWCPNCGARMIDPQESEG